MTIERYVPADILKPFIKAFVIIESENGMKNTLLPDTSIVMAFRYKGNVTFAEEGIKNSLPLSVITGLRKSTRLIDYSKESATFLVLFKEGGAAAFFKESLDELFGVSISLDHLIHPQKLNEMEDRLAEARNNPQRISIIEQFLLTNLRKPQLDQLIGNAIQAIKLTNGNIRIKDLAAALNISQDPFEKKFRRVIGTSPKQFSTIVRLRNLISHYSPDQTLTDAAFEAGYFDQSHFIKDFRSFTGQAPLDFFKSSSYW